MTSKGLEKARSQIRQRQNQAYPRVQMPKAAYRPSRRREVIAISFILRLLRFKGGLAVSYSISPESQNRNVRVNIQRAQLSPASHGLSPPGKKTLQQGLCLARANAIVYFWHMMALRVRKYPRANRNPTRFRVRRAIVKPRYPGI